MGEIMLDKTCGFEHEIVSYMYDELGAADRTRFETHLAVCGSCTDQFAAVSLSRFSVFEWQKEAFAPLPTPEIFIPYKPRKAVAESAGWFAGLSEMFAFARSPLAVGATFAMVLAIGLIEFNYVGNRGNDIASNVNAPAAVEQEIELPKETATVLKEVGSDKIVAEGPIALDDEFRSVKVASRDVRLKSTRQTSSRRAVEPSATPNPMRQARRAPVLGDLADDDEDSLRLSDMLDGIGG